MGEMEEKLKELTGVVFSNWFALKVALEHGLGGPPAVQNSKVQDLLDDVVAMTIELSSNDDYSNISDYVQDFMDDEFNVLLEDDSSQQVTKEIFNFCKLLQMGNETEIANKLEKLPVKTSILASVLNNSRLPRVEDDSDSDDDDDDDDDDNVNKMEQDDPDPGWTVVRHKRK